MSGFFEQLSDFFLDPNKWEEEHSGTVGGLLPTPEQPIQSDFQAPMLQFAQNDALAEMEPAFKGTNPMLEWEDKQMLAKGGFLSKDEERMYGVNNWKNPVSYGGDDGGP